MKVSVDENKCIGAGQCVMTAPDVFDQRDDDGVAIVLAPAPAEADRPAVRDAAALCPAAAITVTEG